MIDRAHSIQFKRLERTIKTALAVYLIVLLLGIGVLSAGPETVREAMAGTGGGWWYLGCGAAAAFGLFYAAISSIRRLSDLHVWLDRRLFGFLERSNEIIFQAVVRVLESDDRERARSLPTGERYSMIRSVFSNLSADPDLFDALMSSGIFRTWIWYWAANYGTFSFSILAAAAFAAVLGSADPASRDFFTVCWSGALLHVGINVVLGYRLVRMTRAVSDSIASSYRPRIARLVHEIAPR